jgi:hypothetical protein
MSTIDERSTLRPVWSGPEDIDGLVLTSARAPSVTVVLPCLNESQSVGACVTEARRALEAAGYRGEVVVVDNNSTDGSGPVAERAGARVVAETTPGYGAALRAGFAAARGDVIVMADADATYPLDRLAELVDPVASGSVDVIVGARLEGVSHRSMPLTHRYIGTPALTRLVQLASGPSQLSDSQSGFRACRRETLDAMALRSTGMELASEMLIRANQLGLRVGEVPLGYRVRTGESKLRTWSDGLRHFRLIVELGPHIALWYPGIALMTCSVALLLASLFYPGGIAVGGVEWQPVFAASIFAVVGVCAATVGSVLAALAPGTSTMVRGRFGWVTAARTARRVRRAALGLVALGVGLDSVLFWRWAAGAAPLAVEQQVAALAQVALVVGAVLLMVSALHAVLVRSSTPAA